MSFPNTLYSVRLLRLEPIYEFCKSRGNAVEGEAIRVGAWPAQFIPVFSELNREAVAEAETVDFEGMPVRVVRAAHLALIALSVGRGKDFARFISLIEAGSVVRQELRELASKHGLSDAWKRFEDRLLDE